MSFKRIVKGLPSKMLPAQGLLDEDREALTSCQSECIGRLGVAKQMEQEGYFTEHPEVKAMIKIFLHNMIKTKKRKGLLKEAGLHFTRPFEVLDKEIRSLLNLPPTGSYIEEDKPVFRSSYDYKRDIEDIIVKHHPTDMFDSYISHAATLDTMSSSFISLVTSDTTLPTPEPVPTPELTISEFFYEMVSNTVDKAIYQQVDESTLRYDTAYVELSKAVENAMEIPVIEIKEDLALMFNYAYQKFEEIIDEKERIAAEIAWEKRMRKKLKRTLRRQDNFKGYVTPPTPKSSISSHESYKKPPPPQCECHPQFYYNRYPKDRFGIYHPSGNRKSYEGLNVTSTPPISIDSEEEDGNTLTHTKSEVSKKSAVSGKSNKSKKSTTKKTTDKN